MKSLVIAEKRSVAADLAGAAADLNKTNELKSQQSSR
jgi:hypothetical protein